MSMKLRGSRRVTGGVVLGLTASSRWLTRGDFELDRWPSPPGPGQVDVGSFAERSE